MSSLGAIGAFTGTQKPIRSRIVASWAIDDLRAPHTIPANGYLAGIVAEGYPTPMVGARLRCYYLPTGAMIAQAFSAADGSFRFDGLEPGQSWYYVTAIDAPGGTAYRAKTYDQVVVGT